MRTLPRSIMLRFTTLLLFALVTMTRGDDENEFTSISHGMIFKPMERELVFYQSSIPLLYIERVDIKEEEIDEYSALALWTKSDSCAGQTQFDSQLQRCQQSATNFTSTANEQEGCERCKNQGLIEKTKSLLTNELRSALFELRNDLDVKSSNEKRKREISLFGRFFRFCCDVALQDELAPVEADLEKLSSRYSNMRAAVSENHRNLLTIQKELHTLGREVSQAFNEMLQKIDRLTRRSEMRAAITLQFKLLVQHYRQITNYCQTSRIPVNVVRPSALKRDLESLEKELHKHGKSLSVPVSRIHEYYKLPIASCQFLHDEISILLKIPTQRMNSTYQLFEVMSLPFSFRDEICQVRAPKSVVLHDKTTGEVKVLTGQALENCNGAQRLCAITSAIQDENSVCIERIYRGETIDNIKRSCSFECREKLDPYDNALPIINVIAYREYIIAKPSGILLIEQENGTRTRLQWRGNNTGAFHLRLHCTAKMIQQHNGSEVLLIDNDVPCFRNDRSGESGKLMRILPSAWCNLPDGVIKNTLEDRNKYRLTEKLINTDWKQSTPTVGIQTDLEFEKKLDKLVLKKIERSDRVPSKDLFGSLEVMVALVVGCVLVLILVYCIGTLHKEKTSMKKHVYEMNQDQNHPDANNDSWCEGSCFLLTVLEWLAERMFPCSTIFCWFFRCMK